MKLKELKENEFFIVPGSKKYRGLWMISRIYGDGLIAIRKAPFFDKVRLIDDGQEIFKFDEEVICHGT